MPSDSPPLTDKPTRRRGRPPKDLARPYTETRRELIQAGLALLTEKGYSSVGIDQILRSVNVPKGSFYHYFKSKEAFGLVLIEAYADYFARKLDRFLLNADYPPLQRLQMGQQLGPAFVIEQWQRHGDGSDRQAPHQAGHRQQQAVERLPVVEHMQQVAARRVIPHPGQAGIARRFVEYQHPVGLAGDPRNGVRRGLRRRMAGREHCHHRRWRLPEQAPQPCGLVFAPVDHLRLPCPPRPSASRPRHP